MRPDSGEQHHVCSSDNLDCTKVMPSHVLFIFTRDAVGEGSRRVKSGFVPYQLCGHAEYPAVWLFANCCVFHIAIGWLSRQQSQNACCSRLIKDRDGLAEEKSRNFPHRGFSETAISSSNRLP